MYTLQRIIKRETDLMNNDLKFIDIGFIITKPPLETGIVNRIISYALTAVEKGKNIELFLISDGIWLAKKNQKNKIFEKFLKLKQKGVKINVSKEHIDAAGIKKEEIVSGLILTDKLYKNLVELVMEKWEKVITI